MPHAVSAAEAAGVKFWVDQHLKALLVVYNQSIKGSGDEISQAVVYALAEVVDRELS